MPQNISFHNAIGIAMRTSVEDADSSMKIEIRRMRSAQCNKYLDKAGNIYVSDAAHGNYQIFDAKGQLLLFVGNRSETFERAAYMLPAGIDVDEDGRVYMVDQYYRKLDIYRPVEMKENEGFIGAWAK